MKKLRIFIYSHGLDHMIEIYLKHLFQKKGYEIFLSDIDHLRPFEGSDVQITLLTDYCFVSKIELAIFDNLKSYAETKEKNLLIPILWPDIEENVSLPEFFKRQKSYILREARMEYYGFSISNFHNFSIEILCLVNSIEKDIKEYYEIG
ncbi:MAG TPA: hypothetical protein PKL37_23305 [Panacibacter sp.]|nr:hypothetical protein [Panacibacter sp.]